MLKQLYIKNFTLIDELDIQLHPGFSVITGETGAGKSIILGAIGLLLGNRADTKAIKAGCDRCTIEAHFDLSRYDMQSFFAEHDIDYDADDTIIRRELTAAGKSRAFINDTPVSLSLMRELGESLVDIHSQHQNLLLQKRISSSTWLTSSLRTASCWATTGPHTISITRPGSDSPSWRKR